MATATKKLPETTRRGWIPTSPVASGNRNVLETITRINGFDVVGLQRFGDIMLVDTDTGVKKRFVPPSGITIEIRREQGEVSRVSDDGKTIIINRELRKIPYIDDAVYAEYNAAPTEDLFDRDVIYVVERETFLELLATCALAGEPLPAIFAVPEGEVYDASRRNKIGYERLVIHDPKGHTKSVKGSRAKPEQETLFNL